MKKNKFNDRNKNNQYFFVGHKIRASKVLLIDENNKNCGVVSLQEALKRAERAGLDLVQVNELRDKPTCKLLDFGKFRYEQSKKDKLAKKKQRESVVKIKEIKLRPSTDSNDIKIKAKKACQFLNEGHKIKLTIIFRGRELSHKSLGEEVLNEFLSYISDGQLESSPSLTGKQLIAFIQKKSVVNTKPAEKISA